MLKIQVIKRKGGWYWRVVAGNRKTLCHSEKYKRKRDAWHAARLVRESLRFASFEIVEV